MTWRERMHPQVSKAEIEVMQELCAAGVNERMVTQKPICLKRTVPDFSFHMENANYTIYIDAEQTHSSHVQQAKDDDIDNTLERRGYKVLRCRYKAPLTKKRKAQFLLTNLMLLNIHIHY